MRIVDKNGKRRDLDWLARVFGRVEVMDCGPGPGYRVKRLQDSGEPAPASCTIKVLRNGQPAQGVKVAWGWPDAPLIPGTDIRAEILETNAEGQVAPAMGAYYWPKDSDRKKQRGPYNVWITSGQKDVVTNSEAIVGLGMIGNTNHRHLDVTFEIWEDEAPTPPEPPPEEPKPEPPPEEPPPVIEPPTPEAWEGLVSRLDRIIELLEALAEKE